MTFSDPVQSHSIPDLVTGGVCLVALALRIALPYRAVFGQEFVAFIESDAWHHMRLVDATVRNFPHRIWFDLYSVYPGGEAVRQNKSSTGSLRPSPWSWGLARHRSGWSIW